MEQADAGDFAAFRAYVVSDRALIARLQAITDPAAFLDATVDLGVAAGFRFDRSEVERTLRDGRFAWLTHWMPHL